VCKNIHDGVAIIQSYKFLTGYYHLAWTLHGYYHYDHQTLMEVSNEELASPKLQIAPKTTRTQL